MKNWLSNWATGRGWKNFEEHERKSLDCLEKTVSRNTGGNNSANKDFPGRAYRWNEGFAPPLD